MDLNAGASKSNDVLKMLQFGHKRIRDLLFHYEQSEDPQHKLSFAETALNELTIHSIIEEDFFYPFLLTQNAEIAKLSKEGREEHEQIEIMVRELARYDNWTEDYDTIFSALTESLNNHIDWEESMVFPRVADLSMEGLVDQMNRRRDELLLREGMDHERDFTPQTLLFTDELHDRRSA